MHALTAAVNLALALSLVALTLSTLRGGGAAARMRSWAFFSAASFMLAVHAGIETLGLSWLKEASDLSEVVTLSFLVVGFALLYGSDRERLRRLEGEAQRDSSTGLYNRRTFRTLVSGRLAKLPGGTPCALALLDLDGFKQVNDAEGHLRGDQLLQLVAAALRANLRERDIAARYGGDEFIVYFEDCRVGDAERVLRRIRTSVAAVSRYAGSTVTISAGLASYPESGKRLDALTHAADEALIAGKHAGKDQVRTAG